MLTRLFYTLVSLVTVVGGHFLNRRFDRAVLFFALLLLWYLAGVVTLWLLISIQGPTPDLFAQLAYLRYIAYGSMILLIVSAGVTWRDYGRRSAAVSQWNLSGRVGAVLLSLVGVVVIGYGIMATYTMGSSYAAMEQEFATGNEFTMSEPPGDGDASSFEFTSDFFSARVFYGGAMGVHDAASPPEGEGYLVGRITRDGDGAAGVALTLTLNKKYESETLHTDADGRFVLRLPVGQWEVNVLRVSGWEDKPAGDFVLVSGEEPPFSGDKYHPEVFGHKGLTVRVRAQRPATPQLTLSFAERVRLLQPDPDERRTPMDLEQGQIEWRSYPGAAKYQVNLIRITRNERGATYRPIASQPVSGGNALPLDAFATVDHDGEPQEYTVQVFAFDEQGNYLSESAQQYAGKQTFVLSADKAFVSDRVVRQSGGEPSEFDVEAYRQNSRRLDAARLLIEEQMYTPAKTLLERSDGASVSAGRKAALMGYWHASQGQCNQANAYFEQARGEGGRDCVSATFRQGCAVEAATDGG